MASCCASKAWKYGLAKCASRSARERQDSVRMNVDGSSWGWPRSYRRQPDSARVSSISERRASAHLAASFRSGAKHGDHVEAVGKSRHRQSPSALKGRPYGDEDLQ